MKQQEEICCPVFDLEKWNEKTFHWDHKKFLKATVPTFFHIPLSPMIGNRIKKLMKLAESSNVLPQNKEDVLLLFTDPHAFKSEIYLSVTADIPKARNAALSGTFLGKVFDGAYSDIPKFMRQMERFLEGKHEKAEKYYVHYAYCPKCAKKYGHNYMVLFAQV
ncbi:hydrolase [Flavobacteriaceae bacterium 3-367]